MPVSYAIYVQLQSTELVSLYIGYWTLNNYYYYYVVPGWIDTEAKAQWYRLSYWQNLLWCLAMLMTWLLYHLQF